MIEKIQIIPNDFKESFENMPLESAGRVILALFRFANEEDESEVLGDDVIAKAVFPTIKSHVMRHEEFRRTKAENGRRGGGQLGNSNASKNDLKQPKTTKNDQKRTPIPNPFPIPNPTPIKKTYGECENVLLSDDEYEKIKAKGLTNLIDELSLYIEGSGKKYKSHYAVLRQWGNRREKEKQEKKETITPLSGAGAKNMFNRYPQRTDYDFKALEDKLIKN